MYYWLTLKNKTKKKKHRINVKKKTKKENLHEIELALLHKFGLLMKTVIFLTIQFQTWYHIYFCIATLLRIYFEHKMVTNTGGSDSSVCTVNKL